MPQSADRPERRAPAAARRRSGRATPPLAARTSWWRATKTSRRSAPSSAPPTERASGTARLRQDLARRGVTRVVDAARERPGQDGEQRDGGRQRDDQLAQEEPAHAKHRIPCERIRIAQRATLRRSAATPRREGSLGAGRRLCDTHRAGQGPESIRTRRVEVGTAGRPALSACGWRPRPCPCRRAPAGCRARTRSGARSRADESRTGRRTSSTWSSSACRCRRT